MDFRWWQREGSQPWQCTRGHDATDMVLLGKGGFLSLHWIYQCHICGVAIKVTQPFGSQAVVMEDWSGEGAFPIAGRTGLHLAFCHTCQDCTHQRLLSSEEEGLKFSLRLGRGPWGMEEVAEVRVPQAAGVVSLAPSILRNNAQVRQDVQRARYTGLLHATISRFRCSQCGCYNSSASVHGCPIGGWADRPRERESLAEGISAPAAIDRALWGAGSAAARSGVVGVPAFTGGFARKP